MLAERYFPDDPNTCLLKLRQYGEVLAQLVAACRLYVSAEEAQFDLLRRLQDQGILPRREPNFWRGAAHRQCRQP